MLGYYIIMPAETRKPTSRGRGRPIKNVIVKIPAPAKEIARALFSSSRKKRTASLKTARHS